MRVDPGVNPCSVQHSIAASRQAALEDALFVAVSVEPGSRTAIKRSVGSAFPNIVTDSAGDRTDSGARCCALGDTLRDDDFFGVDLALVPILGESVGIDTLHIDDRVGLGSAARQACRETGEYC